MWLKKNFPALIAAVLGGLIAWQLYVRLHDYIEAIFIATAALASYLAVKKNFQWGVDKVK